MDITICDKCGDYTPYSKRKSEQLCWDCQKDKSKGDE